MSLQCAFCYLCGWIFMCMTSTLTLFILCIYVGFNQLFYGFNIFNHTNSVSTSCSITTFEFQCLYINCSQSMPGLCALSGNPYIRYATDVRIWNLFPYFLNSIFYWNMPLIQIHYNFKSCRSWSQLVSNPCWPTYKLTQCIPLEGKGIISDELLWLYEIKLTYRKFLDKLLGLLVLMNNIKAKY